MLATLVNEVHEVAHEEGYLDLMRSLPHWGFELTLEGLTGIGWLLIGIWWQKRHDRKHHPDHVK